MISDSSKKKLLGGRQSSRKLSVWILLGEMMSVDWKESNTESGGRKETSNASESELHSVQTDSSKTFASEAKEGISTDKSFERADVFG